MGNDMKNDRNTLRRRATPPCDREAQIGRPLVTGGSATRWGCLFFLALFSLLSCEHPAKVDIGELVEALNALDADSSVEDEDDLAADDLTDLSGEDDSSESDVTDSTDTTDSTEVEPDDDPLLTETEIEAEADLSAEAEAEAEDDVVVDDDTMLSNEMICTGQTKCYDNTGEITCPTEGNDFYGQDAQYAALGYCVPRNYTVSGSGGADVVTDNNTGLIWQRTLPATYDGCTGGTPTGSTCAWQEANDYCNNLSYGGESDWRLPSRKELETLPDYDRYGPATDVTIFPGVHSNWHWSSSSYLADATTAWVVSFYGGHASNDYKTNANYVRCVRGSTMSSSLFSETTVGSVKIVTDATTGLIWTKAYNSPATWINALSYCENMSYAKSTDWRLPNIEELKTLIDSGSQSPASSFPGITSSEVWSSSSARNDAAIAWYVSFVDGEVNYTGKANTKYARCVRSALAQYCGNSIREGDEQCDEGMDNGTPGSYCSDLCVNLSEQQYPIIADTGRDSDFTITTPVAGEPIVTDTVTGLVWQQTISSYTWENAYNYCETLTYANESDWHLPTPHELESIVDYGTYDPAIYAAFPDMPSTAPAIYFWSGLYSANDSTDLNAWIVSFYDGSLFYGYLTELRSVRCVRRPQVEGTILNRYTESTGPDSKVMVLDNWTGIYWTKEIAPTLMSFDDAQTYCEALDYSGHDDWVIMGINETRTLVDYSLYNPANPAASTFPNTSYEDFWAGTTRRAVSSDTAWFVGFASGNIYYGLATSQHSVRCGRTD